MSKIKVEQFIAKIDELTPTENNPRQISKQDFENLKKSMKEFPEMREIRKVVVDENNRVLGGHMRIKALKELGESEVPVDKVYGLTEKQKRRFVVQDNIQNGEWDMDELANSWSDLPLDEWGLGVKDFGDIINEASNGSIQEFSDDTDYDISKLYREKVNEGILEEIKKGVENGEIRGEIEEVLMDRAKQCSVFNFDGFKALCSDDYRFNIMNGLLNKTPMISHNRGTISFHQNQGDRNDGNAVLYNGDCSWKKSFALKMMMPAQVEQHIAIESNRVLFRENVMTSKLFPPICVSDESGKIVGEFKKEVNNG